MRAMPLGRVLADIAGTHLEASDRARLLHPQIGGVILFSRNFSSSTQLATLCAEIRALREPGLIVAVDHEGGRVQRFREGFTAIPPMRALGKLWDKDQEAALKSAKACGLVLAAELTACGITLSFAPVVDLDYGESGVIGNRAFHRDPQIVATLAAALIGGMSDGGLASCGKHFPGHGYIRGDSHHEIPVDDRSLDAIEREDMLPYRRLIPGGLAAVMPAHVIYPKVDDMPAGFSKVWLGDILRGKLGFNGVIFSDDLSMKAASIAGNHAARAATALGAGCDMVLVCNEPAAADAVLQALAAQRFGPAPVASLARLHRSPPASSRAKLELLDHYREAVATLSAAGLG